MPGVSEKVKQQILAAFIDGAKGVKTDGVLLEQIEGALGRVLDATYQKNEIANNKVIDDMAARLNTFYSTQDNVTQQQQLIRVMSVMVGNLSDAHNVQQLKRQFAKLEGALSKQYQKNAAKKSATLRIETPAENKPKHPGRK